MGSWFCDIFLMKLPCVQLLIILSIGWECSKDWRCYLVDWRPMISNQIIILLVITEKFSVDLWFGVLGSTINRISLPWLHQVASKPKDPFDWLVISILWETCHPIDDVMQTSKIRSTVDPNTQIINQQKISAWWQGESLGCLPLVANPLNKVFNPWETHS